MKIMVLIVGMAMTMLSAAAQNQYIVKTKNVKQSVAVKAADSASGQVAEESEPQDFLGKNFKYHSLCDWEPGMKFMVMPEKYDLIVNTFCDSLTDKEVSSGKLRYHIMVYRGHADVGNRGRMYFLCQDDNKVYYYETPNGDFDSYCNGKLGVPTLAFLDDVDIAHEKLLGQRVFTKGDVYRIDTEANGEGYEEVTVEDGREVKVVAVGVGSRSFPVKIIVEDDKGNQFYQIVAMSKTNSGMRDDEFDKTNAKHAFYGSFELANDYMSLSKDITKYLGKLVHTKYATMMHNIEQDRDVKITRLTQFEITEIAPHANSTYYTLTLKDPLSRAVYKKDVTFQNTNVAGDIDGNKEDYFAYLFAMGAGKIVNSSPTMAAMIRAGRVIPNMTKDEVLLAVGEPNNTVNRNGVDNWIYNRSKGKKLRVIFGKDQKVRKTEVFR